jgi:DNA-binding transcriptional MerR regulator
MDCDNVSQTPSNLMTEDKITKLYYSIGEVAKLVGVETHVLRYWENEFPQLNPRKNNAGRRTYTREDLEAAYRIYELLRVDKYTLAGARQVLENEDNTSPVRRSIKRQELLNVRLFLENIREQLA